MVVGEFTASSIANEQDRMEDDQRQKLTTSKVDYAKLDADVAALKALAAKVRCYSYGALAWEAAGSNTLIDSLATDSQSFTSQQSSACPLIERHASTAVEPSQFGKQSKAWSGRGQPEQLFMHTPGRATERRRWRAC